MYNVVIDIVKSIENIIKSYNKDFNNKVFNMSFSMKSPFFQIEIIFKKNVLVLTAKE